MELTYIGHHSWLLSKNETHFLIDPILEQDFGNSTLLKFPIHPSRNILYDKLPLINGVFLTNEHAGHFDISTIKKLSNQIPIFVYSMIPYSVVEVLELNGFKVICCEPFSEYLHCDIKFMFCPGPKEIPLWENRVCSLIFISEAESLFIQSDTKVSEKVVEIYKNNCLNKSNAWIIPNNSQLFPTLNVGPFDNLLPIRNIRKSQFIGLKVLSDLLFNCPDNFYRFFNNYFFSGSGYIIPGRMEKPFLWSNDTNLTPSLKKIVGERGLHSLRAGFSFSIKNNRLIEKRKEFVEDSIDPAYESLNTDSGRNYALNLISDEPSSEANLAKLFILLEKELKVIAPYFLSSFVGKDLVSLDSYLNNKLDGNRALFRFHHPKISPFVTQYAFDCNSCSFKLDHTPANKVIHSFPYGLEVGLNDFFLLANGEVQIWDLSMYSIKQWYLGSHLRSIVAFLFEYYSEQVQPELFRKILLSV